jgi:hypothetical protein
MPPTKLARKNSSVETFPAFQVILACCTACSYEIELVSFLAESQRYYQFRPHYNQSVLPYLTRNSLLDLKYSLQTNSYSVVYCQL